MFLALIKNAFWTIYNLINIKDSRFIKSKVVESITTIDRMRKVPLGVLTKSPVVGIYYSGLNSIETKGTFLTYLLLSGKIDYDLIKLLTQHGSVCLRKIEALFKSLDKGYMQSGSLSEITKKTKIFEELMHLVNLDVVSENLGNVNKDILVRIDVLEDIYYKVSDYKNYLTSVDKNVRDTRHYDDVVLDTIMIWADADYLLSHGDLNCREISTTIISRPPDITDDEDIMTVLDLYSKIAMVLRDALYILDTSDTIIKYMASRFHNDEYRHVTRTITTFK